jgi:transcription antitermination protein NusB
MGKRNTGRKLAMQILYQAELSKHPATEEMRNAFFDHHNVGLEETRSWASELVAGVNKHREEFDKLIETYAIGWSLDRVRPVDLCILRLAFYELIYTSSSSGIVINEAIEIARRYAAMESPKFLNGILGKYVKENTCSQVSSRD